MTEKEMQEAIERIKIHLTGKSTLDLAYLLAEGIHQIMETVFDIPNSEEKNTLIQHGTTAILVLDALVSTLK